MCELGFETIDGNQVLTWSCRQIKASISPTSLRPSSESVVLTSKDVGKKKREVRIIANCIVMFDQSQETKT